VIVRGDAGTPRPRKDAGAAVALAVDASLPADARP